MTITKYQVSQVPKPCQYIFLMDWLNIILSCAGKAATLLQIFSLQLGRFLHSAKAPSR